MDYGIELLETAQKLQAFFKQQTEIRNCQIYGSIQKGVIDRYSDIDLSIDVSGIDNGKYLLRIPQLLEEAFPVLFYDYASSLCPEEYIVSCALSERNPFMILDVKCIATPHMTTLQKNDMVNDPVIHILKLWVANAKHWIRGKECSADIYRMGKKALGISIEPGQEEKVITLTFDWLAKNLPKELQQYLNNCWILVSEGFRQRS